MRLFFNELSISPVANSKYAAIDRMAVFTKTVSIARQKGFRNIQCDYPVNTISLADKYSIYDWLNDPIVSRECRDFMYGVIVPPYIDEDEIEFERFVDAVISYENKEFDIPKTKCIGMAASYLYDLPTISLLSIPLWKQHRLFVIVEKEGSISVENIYNISSYESFDIPDLTDYIVSGRKRINNA